MDKMENRKVLQSNAAAVVAAVAASNQPEDAEFQQIKNLFRNRQEIVQPVEETALMVLPEPEADEEPQEETTGRLPEGPGCVILTAAALVGMVAETVCTAAMGTSPVWIPLASTACLLAAAIKVWKVNVC